VKSPIRISGNDCSFHANGSLANVVLPLLDTMGSSCLLVDDDV
jgi:hypothetical protein